MTYYADYDADYDDDFADESDWDADDEAAEARREERIRKARDLAYDRGEPFDEPETDDDELEEDE